MDDKRPHSEFGHRLAQLRKDLLGSQTAAAAKSGFSVDTWSDWERGIRKPAWANFRIGTKTDNAEWKADAESFRGLFHPATVEIAAPNNGAANSPDLPAIPDPTETEKACVELEQLFNQNGTCGMDWAGYPDPDHDWTRATWNLRDRENLLISCEHTEQDWIEAIRFGQSLLEQQRGKLIRLRPAIANAIRLFRAWHASARHMSFPLEQEVAARCIARLRTGLEGALSRLAHEEQTLRLDLVQGEATLSSWVGRVQSRELLVQHARARSLLYEQDQREIETLEIDPLSAHRDWISKALEDFLAERDEKKATEAEAA